MRICIFSVVTVHSGVLCEPQIEKSALARFIPIARAQPSSQARQPPMSTIPKSRWADDEEDVVAEALRKQEKELKKKAKAEKQRQLEEAQKARQQRIAESPPVSVGAPSGRDATETNGDFERPAKRRRLSEEADKGQSAAAPPAQLLRFPAPEWGPCRHVDNFEKLNHIEEGSYGWVSRAKESATGEVVALKKLKMDNANDGFPVTGLREIQTLMESRHSNIVNLREVVMGDGMNE